MLGTNTSKSLLFPKLRFETSINIKGNGWDKDTTVYKLDWKWTDEQKEKSFNNWKTTYHKDKNIWYVRTLPEKYDNLINNFRFVLDGKYLREINRTSHNAFFEWNLQRSFDTSIREMCLEPAISYTQVAFRLLSDCLYNAETNYYERDYAIRTIAPHLLLYKFWAHQTGRGIIRDHSLFSKLDWYISEKNPNYNNNKDKVGVVEKINELYVDFKNHEIEFDKSISDITPKDKTNIGTIIDNK